MKVLLCAATEMEIAPTIHFLTTQPTTAVDVLITGVGLMSAVYAITKTIAVNPPQLLIQAGVAGTFTSKLSLGEVVVVKHDAVGDLGVVENGTFQSAFKLGLVRQDFFPWQKEKLSNKNEILWDQNLPIVNGVTVNEITTQPKKINYYKDVVGAEIETMEGAGFHYAALMEKIPFLQIRSISNFIGERDKTKWQLQKAVQQLNVELQKILLKYSVQ